MEGAIYPEESAPIAMAKKRANAIVISFIKNRLFNCIGGTEYANPKTMYIKVNKRTNVLMVIAIEIPMIPPKRLN